MIIEVFSSWPDVGVSLQTTEYTQAAVIVLCCGVGLTMVGVVL